VPGEVGDPVRWGILGTGKIARLLAAALAGSETGELVAVGSRDAARAGAFAAEFGVPRAFGTYEEVVSDEGVELVYVATPHPFHREWAVRAADTGKHVLCEKPMAVTHADAERIVEAARRGGVFLLEAFAYRCHPQTQRLVELVREGAIGEIRMIDAVFGYDAGPEPGNYLMVHELAGGAILDVGCYTTSMAHLIAAAATARTVAPAIDVAAAGYLGPTGVDHTAAATLTFDGGIVARVATSIQASLDSVLRVYGSRGRITVPSPWLPGRIGTEARIIVERAGASEEVVDIPLEAEVYTVEVDAVDTFVRKGELSPSAMMWEDSLENMRTLDRWRASIGLRYGDDEA
jgi:predicted dehydrogenase